MIRLSIIYLNGKISNIYVNTGYYAVKVAKEMNNNLAASKVELVEKDVDLTHEEFMKFIESKTTKNKPISL